MFDESLCHGLKSDHSLINPNQVRHCGVVFWDNPHDKNRVLGIEVDHITIRMKLRGTKACFESRSPTDKELEECPKFIMTSPDPWNPTSVSLQETRMTSAPATRRTAAVQVNQGATCECLHHDSDGALPNEVGGAA